MPARHRRLFAPILAGAELNDRLLACVGVAIAIAIVGIVGAIVHGDGIASPWIVAPIGASSVLVFAVPASPMAQPWPTIGGNCLSALVGLAVGRALGHGAIACGLAVGLAIAVMSVTRSLHPPGGAAALTAAIESYGWLFPFAPMAMNAVVLVALGWIFHRMRGHSYPHRALPAAAPRVAPDEADMDAVLAELGETYDISREDLREIVTRLEARSLA